ncbi:hypothetical protein BO70DRAFT_360776 [Aspergillus heteromorphus CBS 117.55]|uniref:GST N-terminal domain-containing protein n=1 Tax=Aspergillus heteromorphus CBS 117.55 TaxID=1448321 RepID=A0A317WHI1_9EURO|nr:uncharacterized protein BO70DRAFT_360776 [Aspergillus heteromorphus CBS 117.55]PWY85944.1 hypothetical protein BO70DRAFT_360776 [Aspergillus heteromorphus CBS 117.55]
MTALTFYDIAMRPPVTKTCCSPNPWKARLALNFKGVAYTTSWVKLPEVAPVRRGLGLPAGRKFADGTDFCTLPIVSDPTTGSLIGDSFDIAVYLQKTYPDSGAGNLFPEQSLDYTFTTDGPLMVPLSERNDIEFGDYARFNTSIDALFTSHVALMQNMPLDPETAEQTKAEFVRRAGVSSWDDFAITSEMRENIKTSFHDALGELAKLFSRDRSGPFLLGQQASYADLIVGGWLRMMGVTMPEAEWEEARGWHNGAFGRLYDALQEYAEVK